MTHLVESILELERVEDASVVEGSLWLLHTWERGAEEGLALAEATTGWCVEGVPTTLGLELCSETSRATSGGSLYH
jgi:hypothetical protein